MRNSRLAAGVLAAIFGLGSVATGWTQMTENASNPTQSKPASPTTNLVPTEPMSAPLAAAPSSGQIQSVSYDNKILGFEVGKHISKTIVIEPGNGQISLDGLGRRDKVNLTLVNPSATPLQFETTERRGTQTVSVVPPHTQQMLIFSPDRSGHEIKFFVMQQPANAVASNQDYVTQQAAAVSTGEQTAMREYTDRQTAQMQQQLDQQTAQLQTSQQEAVREAIGPHGQASQAEHRSAAVRGYW